MKRDYYRILEIARETVGEEIKKAYRRLALLYHPDRNPVNKKEAEEKFKKIGEAYEVLGDPKTRKKYDLLGFNGIKDIVNSIRPSRYYERFDEVFTDREKMEVFSVQQTYDKKYRRGYTLHCSLKLFPRESKDGLEKVIEVKRREYCRTCGGAKRIKDGVCPECFGLGRRSYRRRVRIKISAGTKSGDEIVFPGKGHQGFRGGPSGNLVIQITKKVRK